MFTTNFCNILLRCNEAEMSQRRVPDLCLSDLEEAKCGHTYSNFRICIFLEAAKNFDFA